MIYRTTPPPMRGPLLVWALNEAACWPINTPEFYYTYWIRHAEQMRERAPKPKQTTMELI